MTQCCTHSRVARLRANARKSAWRLDPTRTSGLRRRFIADIRRRFANMRRLVRAAVDTNDVFALREATPRTPRANMRLRVNQPPPPGAYIYMSDAQKAAAFMAWLQQEQAANFLTVYNIVGPLGTGQPPWWRTYIQTAYRQGLQQAGGALAAQGVPVSQAWLDASFLSPVHADRAGLIYSRAYQQLSGVTAAMDAAMSRTLALGISSGIGARELAAQLAEDIDISMARAERIARTEVINAHAEASLNAYEEAGIADVGVLAEFATAQDEQVCPKCQELAETNDGIYALDDARGMIPVHPNCRCAWIPVVLDAEGHILGDRETTDEIE